MIEITDRLIIPERRSFSMTLESDVYLCEVVADASIDVQFLNEMPVDGPPVVLYGENRSADINQPTKGIATVNERIWFSAPGRKDPPIFAGFLLDIALAENRITSRQ